MHCIASKTFIALLNFKHVSYPTFNIAALVDPTIFDFCISCFLQFQLLEVWSYVTSQEDNVSITANKCIAFGCMDTINIGGAEIEGGIICVGKLFALPYPLSLNHTPFLQTTMYKFLSHNYS